MRRAVQFGRRWLAPRSAQRYTTGVVAAALLTTQAMLIGLSIPRNAVTVDEAAHLPVGLRYWDTAQFWAYHHNPPLMRLTAALPLVLLGTPREHPHVGFELHDRGADAFIAEHFREFHGEDHLRLYVIARSSGILFALLGGWVVFLWSRDLFGAAGALVSLALWTFSPWMLAHGGLVTPDVGVTVLMLAGAYIFWRYLRTPSLEGAVWSGILLGLAHAAKFTAVWLVPVWLVLAVVRLSRRAAGVTPLVDTQPASARLTLRRALAHAAVVTAVSLAVLNSIYLWEGTGRRLGEFPLRSPTLTREAAAERHDESPERVNRFRGTWVGGFPTPLPEHYVLGFDDQLWDLEQRGFYKYLGGELRGPAEEGWWYYYLYGLAVKTPLGTLALIALGLILLRRRADRCDLLTELTLLLPVVAVLVPLSFKTGLNGHVRYMLPAIPFLHVFAGRTALWAGTVHWRQVSVCCVVLLGTVASAVRVHPHYLAYFNEAAGGPRGGIEHLADSNLDWGQGLLALRAWQKRHAPGKVVFLAYRGGSEPKDLRLEYQLLNPRDPKPGLHAISATLLIGHPSWGRDQSGNAMSWPPGALHYYRSLAPIAMPGYSIYVYDVSPEQAEQLRRFSASER